MESSATIQVTVLAPTIVERSHARTGECRLVVESVRELPRAPYVGTVRIGGNEETPTGSHPIRLVKHVAVHFVEATACGLLYDVAVDLTDEWSGRRSDYPHPAFGPRRVVEPIETVCKRIAGIFGRHCEQYRPPSVTVRMER